MTNTAEIKFGDEWYTTGLEDWEIAEWSDAGFAGREALVWLTVTGYTPELAARFRDAGYDPQSAADAGRYALDPHEEEPECEPPGPWWERSPGDFR
jgi:hypothetical protein